jgi:PAS domain S-box-containing protein
MTATRACENPYVSDSGSVRRRQTGVLVVGHAEREIQPWLRAEGHAVRAAATVESALAGLDGAPADLVIFDREAGGRELPDVCRALRAAERLDDAWLLAITAVGQRRQADAALAAGADDWVHRPFTRAELLARARSGLRAVRQRSDASLLRALMVNVPGAIYRTAWHANHRVELISDEIERISGYAPINFIVSARRTLPSIVHPGDLERVTRAVTAAHDRDEPFEVEYRIVRADGEVRWVLDRGQIVRGSAGRIWVDGAIVDVTDRRAAEAALRRAEIDAARTEELRAARGRIIQAADAARRKIERDLHDGAQQRLVSMAIQVQIALARLESDPASAGPFLESLGSELQEASGELRELARGIHPSVLTDRGLAPAIAALASRAPVPVDVVDLPAGRLPAAIEAAAYFTVAEALTNVAKYADATEAVVRVAPEGDDLVVEVRDDGVGGAQPGAGSGLNGLADRLGAVEGSLEVVSPVGEGTVVRAVLPLRVASGT